MTLKTLATLAAGGLSLALGTLRAEPLRVLCYNLRYITPGDKDERAWTARRDLAAEVLKSQNADIVGIQEGLAPMLNDLADRVPGYAVIGVGREDGLDRGEYAAILVKPERFRIRESGTFWLSDTPDVPGSCTWGNTVTRICTWATLLDRTTGKIVHVFNVHLDHQSDEARQKGTALVLSKISPKLAQGPVIFTGDFNAAVDDPLHAAIREAGLADTWQVVKPDAPAAESGTVHGYTGRRDEARIDYIYASPDLKPTAAEILYDQKDGHYPSDHFPIVVTLE